MNLERYPLTWPVGQPRTPDHRRLQAAFKLDFARARDEALHSLTLLETRRVVLSSNVPLRQDGLPLANASEPRDPGVAIYFDRWTGKIGNAAGVWRPFVISCDTYSKVKWNLRAIGATVEALRSIQRHGASSMLEQAFTGFAALPQAGVEKPWWEVLGAKGMTEEEVKAVYRQLAALHHPDRGGDGVRMAEINVAYDAALASFRRQH